MKYSILKIKMKEKFNLRDVEKFRGYILNNFPEDVETHNHLGSNKFNYSFPKLQYRLLKNNLAILALEEADIINKKIFEFLEYVNINNNMYFDLNKEIETVNYDIKHLPNSMIKYRFITPYIALNGENYNKYIKGEILLDKIMVGNILEVLKGINYWLDGDQKIIVKSNLKSKNRKLKDVNMIGFEGTFEVNIDLPDYFALGKRKAIGYGTFVKETWIKE